MRAPRVGGSARGRGFPPRLRTSDRRRRWRVRFSPCWRVCWPAGRKWWRSRFLFFLPPTGFWFLAVSQVSENHCGKLMVCEVKTQAVFSS